MTLICKRCGAEDTIYVLVNCTYEMKSLDDEPADERSLSMQHLGRVCCGSCGRSSKRADLIAKEDS